MEASLREIFSSESKKKKNVCDTKWNEVSGKSFPITWGVPAKMDTEQLLSSVRGFTLSRSYLKSSLSSKSNLKVPIHVLKL